MARINLSQVKVRTTAQRLALPLVQKTTRQVLVGAQRLVPRGDHKHGSGRPVAGLSLLRSLQGEIAVHPNSVDGRVGSDRDWAATVHQGSKPHRIVGRGKKLRFEWERGYLLLDRRGRRGRRGRVFFRFDAVSHPGNKRPVRYLTTPLALFGRLNGFRVTTTPVSRSRLP